LTISGGREYVPAFPKTELAARAALCDLSRRADYARRNISKADNIRSKILLILNAEKVSAIPNKYIYQDAKRPAMMQSLHTITI